MIRTNAKEYLDLVDERDNVIGREERNIVYSRGLRNYRVVNIFVFNQKKEILLPKRDSTRRIFPNCYDFSCGEHVQSGETYEEAAVRGLREELNLTGVNLIPVGKLTPEDGVSSFMRVFKIICREGVSPNKKEGVASINFVPLEKIKQMIKSLPKSFKEDLPKVINLLEGRLNER